MNILVTGANGQLGNEIKVIAKTRPDINWTFADITDTHGEEYQIQLDCTDPDAVRSAVETYAIDIIINCAAYTAVDRAESDVELCTKLNVDIPANLARAIQARQGTLIHVSTDYVFDGHTSQPYTEDTPTNPVTAYGRTKRDGELQALQHCEKTMIVRTAWLYSTFGNNFVKTMLRLGQERNQLGVVFDQIGTPTYARDLASAILAAVDHGIVSGIYHFTDEGVTSWYDFTKAIHRIAGITSCHVLPLHTAEYPTPASRPHYSVLDKTKIKKTFGIEIPHWEESLEACIKRICTK